MGRAKKYFTEEDYKEARKVYNQTYKERHPEKFVHKPPRVWKPYKYPTEEIRQQATRLRKRIYYLKNKGLTETDAYRSVVAEFEALQKSPENHPQSEQNKTNQESN